MIYSLLNWKSTQGVMRSRKHPLKPVFIAMFVTGPVIPSSGIAFSAREHATGVKTG